MVCRASGFRADVGPVTAPDWAAEHSARHFFTMLVVGFEGTLEFERNASLHRLMLGVKTQS